MLCFAEAGSTVIDAGTQAMAIRKTKIDGGWAWRWYAEPDPDKRYLAMATVIELKSLWSLPRFEWHTRRIHSQLASTPGLLGFSFKGKFPLLYWTLSAWEDGKALQRFVKNGPHDTVMTALPSGMKVFRHVHWKVAGTEVPLSWTEGLRRLDDKAA